MEERDDWKLGDEVEMSTCSRCGKRNRAKLKHCAICGTPLGDGLEADPESLRTLGEAMGGERPTARRATPRPSLRAWWMTAAVLLGIVVLLTWLQTRQEPFLLEDLLPAMPVAATRTQAPALTPQPVASAVATRVVVATPVVVPTMPPVAPSPAPIVISPVPTTVRTIAPPAPPAQPRVRVVPPPPRPVAPTAIPPVATPRSEPATESVTMATPGEPPRVEATAKASLGTDLRDATRAYRAAVTAHNARVDEYNVLADEIERRNAWDESAASIELRRRLDRAREAVEGARVQAESLKARMEDVRARYR